MKTILIAMTLMLGLGLVSCDKEVSSGSSNQNCNCGIITDDALEVGSEIYYTLTVTNDCSGNSQTFYVSENTWLNGYVGSSQCFSNLNSWITAPQENTVTKHVNNKSI